MNAFRNAIIYFCAIFVLSGSASAAEQSDGDLKESLPEIDSIIGEVSTLASEARWDEADTLAAGVVIAGEGPSAALETARVFFDASRIARAYSHFEESVALGEHALALIKKAEPGSRTEDRKVAAELELLAGQINERLAGTTAQARQHYANALAIDPQLSAAREALKRVGPAITTSKSSNPGSGNKSSQ